MKVNRRLGIAADVGDLRLQVLIQKGHRFNAELLTMTERIAEHDNFPDLKTAQQWAEQTARRTNHVAENAAISWEDLFAA